MTVTILAVAVLAACGSTEPPVAASPCAAKEADTVQSLCWSESRLWSVDIDRIKSAKIIDRRMLIYRVVDEDQDELECAHIQDHARVVRELEARKIPFLDVITVIP